eukprot:tig00001085_g6959.t1
MEKDGIEITPSEPREGSSDFASLAALWQARERDSARGRIDGPRRTPPQHARDRKQFKQAGAMDAQAGAVDAQAADNASRARAAPRIEEIAEPDSLSLEAEAKGQARAEAEQNEFAVLNDQLRATYPFILIPFPDNSLRSAWGRSGGMVAEEERFLLERHAGWARARAPGRPPLADGAGRAGARFLLRVASHPRLRYTRELHAFLTQQHMDTSVKPRSSLAAKIDRVVNNPDQSQARGRGRGFGAAGPTTPALDYVRGLESASLTVRPARPVAPGGGAAEATQALGALRTLAQARVAVAAAEEEVAAALEAWPSAPEAAFTPAAATARGLAVLASAYRRCGQLDAALAAAVETELRRSSTTTPSWHAQEEHEALRLAANRAAARVDLDRYRLTRISSTGQYAVTDLLADAFASEASLQERAARRARTVELDLCKEGAAWVEATRALDAFEGALGEEVARLQRETGAELRETLLLHARTATRHASDALRACCAAPCPAGAPRRPRPPPAFAVQRFYAAPAS